MTASAAPEKPVLTFNEKTYDLEALPAEVKQIIATIQTADGQLQVAQQNLALLSAGRAALLTQLEEQMADVEPIEAQVS